ncbi:MAG TPA: FAD-binding oxidoreductase [Thermomicrobiales bacterium]|nr:FAD-binding oxidoreductase [Thermomicrobiales bacterium]
MGKAGQVRQHVDRALDGSDSTVDGAASLPARADVVVIGGGVAGCAVAYQLSKRGRQVALLEMRGICSGASGRNAGVTGSGSAMHTRVGQAVYRLSSENLRLIRDELPAELGEDFSLRLTGSVDIATTEEQWQHLDATVRGLQANGVAAELLDRYELRELMPVADSVLGARLSRNSGHLWPFSLVHALANGARRLGAGIFPWTPAVEVLHGNGVVTGVRTARGTIETDTVVLATNAWTPTLLPDLPRGSVVPARGQILVTQPVGPVLPMPFGTNFDKEYGRQTATGQLLCGGFRRLDEDEGLGHYEEKVTLPVLSGIAGCLAGIFPKVGNVRVVRAWAGIMGFTADGLPLIGAHGSARGMFVTAGYNGGGFGWTCAAGKAIAQLIVDGRCEYDLDPFDPDRFSHGGIAWENPYTVGERNNPKPAGARAATPG